MLLSVITFGLGFASMPRAKPEGKCACGTYPLYLTEAEAGNSMCRRLLKYWPVLGDSAQRHRVQRGQSHACSSPLLCKASLRCLVCAAVE